MPSFHPVVNRNRRLSAAACQSLESRKYLSATWQMTMVEPFGGVQTPIIALPLQSSNSTVDLLINNGGAFASLIGTGDGHFNAVSSPAVPPGTEASQTPFLAGNFITGTTTPDVVTLSNAIPPSASVATAYTTYYSNDGTGIFTRGTEQPQTLPAIGSATVISGVAADFNGDGLTDLALVVEPATGTTLYLMVLTSDGTGGFNEVSDYPLPNSNTTEGHLYEPILVADFGNHQNDVAVTDHTFGTLDVFMGNGDGTFTTAPMSVVLPPGGVTPTVIAAGKFNSTSETDLVLSIDSEVSVYEGNGNGTFFFEHNTMGPAADITAMTTADVDLDGNLDVITNTAIFINQGNGTFSVQANHISISAGTHIGAGNIIAADLNGDGRPDLIGIDTSSDFQVAVNSTLANDTVAIQSVTQRGPDVTLTAVISSVFNQIPDGTMDFYDGTTLLGSTTVTSATPTFDAGSDLTAGTHSFSAKYLASSLFVPSTSSPFSQFILDTPQVIVSGANPTINAGDVTSFTATVTGNDTKGDVPTGSVQFFDNGQSIATEPLNSTGIAALNPDSFPAGQHLITAQYNGDTNFEPASSVAFAQTVDQSTLAPLISTTMLPAIVITGVPIHSKAIVTITNTTSSTITGPIGVSLLASNNGTVLNAATIASLPSAHRSIRAGKSVSLLITIKSISASPGSYTLLAQITSPSGTLINTVTGPTFQVQTPIVTLTASSVSAVEPPTIKPGSGGNFTVLITNTGNIPTTGKATITIGLSTDGVTQSVLLTTLHSSPKIRPGHPLTQHLHFPIPRTQAAGTFHLIVTITQDGSTAAAVGQTQFSIT